MDSHWSSFLVVAAVFTAFSGAASVWGRVQRRRHERRQATWQALLQPDSMQTSAAGAVATQPAPRRSALPPDPSFADSPSFVSDSDSRRAALDEALERMSRQSPPSSAPASNSADWEDTEPSVTLSSVLPHGAGRRSADRGSEAA